MIAALAYLARAEDSAKVHCLLVAGGRVIEYLSETNCCVGQLHSKRLG